jgi:hypothetical protein
MFAQVAHKENIHYCEYAFHDHFQHHWDCQQDHGFTDTTLGIVDMLTLQRLPDESVNRIKF